MKKMEENRREILRDCGQAMRAAILLYAVKELFVAGFSVEIAKVLGAFADKILIADFSLGEQYLKQIVLCLLGMVIVVPMIETLAEGTIFRRSVVYCRTIYRRFFDKSYEAFEKMDRGEIQYHLEDDVIDFYLTYTRMGILIVSIPVILIYLTFSACSISILFTLFIFGLSIIKLWIPAVYNKKKKIYVEAEKKYRSEVRNAEVEMMKKPWAVVCLGIEELWVDTLQKLYRKYYEETGKRKIAWDEITKESKVFFDSFCMVLILFVGAILVARGSLNPGDVVAMTGFFGVFTKLDGDVAELVEKIPVIRNLLDRMDSIYEGREENKGKAGKKESIVEPKDSRSWLEAEKEDHKKNSKKGEKSSAPIWKVEADKLAFSYDFSEATGQEKKNKRYVFQNLHFSAVSGEKVWICGVNGSGKSTLVSILTGLRKSYTGSLFVNGVELKDINQKEYRKYISYAPQEPFLFNGTVRENVRLGNLAAQKEKVDEIMKLFGIDKYADKEVSGNGTNLSGGEKQRVSLARAVLKDAPILLLDEPDNHLDTEIQESLREILIGEQKIVFFISHRRLGAEWTVDKIINLDSGE